MTSSNDKMGDASKPSIPVAIRVEDYDRSTGHVRGYLKTPDGRRVDSVEVHEGDVQARVLSKKRDNAKKKDSDSLRRYRNQRGMSRNNVKKDSDSASAASIVTGGDKMTDQSAYAHYLNHYIERIKNASVDMRGEVAWRETNPDVLSILAKDDDRDVRWNVAQNDNTPADTLRILARDDDRFVRYTVARNKNTPVDVLRIFADSGMRDAVADNESAPTDTLRMLANDDDVDVRRGVACNPNTPVDTLRILDEDDNKKVSNAAGHSLWLVDTGRRRKR